MSESGERLQGRRVAVLGGGLAGLTAAYRLQERGAEVTLYEAQPWVGGRSRTDTLDGYRVDVGTQLIGSMYRRFRRLVHEVGLGEALVPTAGRDALWRGGRAHEVVYGSVSSMIASGGLPLTTKMRLGAVYVPFLSRNAGALDLLAPERAAAAGLDDESIATWGEREIDRAFVRSLVYPQLGAFYGSHPDETSAGFYHILARYGMDVALSAVRGGVGSVAERLATRVREGGGALCCDTAVDSLELGAGAGAVRIATAEGERVYDAAVSAVPAPILAGILRGAPAALTEWLSAVRYRPSLSLALLLDAPCDVRYFGLSFPRGETRYVAAVCVEENKLAELVPAGKGLLVAMPTPETAPALAELESREVVDRMLPEIVKAFPDTERRIVRARVYRWPVGTPVFFPGYLRHVGNFRQSQPDAGTALAIAGDYLYSASVEGAVASGDDAARRLGERLSEVDA
ncbi:MAG TPA: FAD-dependent oxidoreductase [Longimicrobiaceae bacterium]|nr:FAD-dependent oxidoreductase [Longimicrobiaceae bacterium]